MHNATSVPTKPTAASSADEVVALAKATQALDSAEGKLVEDIVHGDTKGAFDVDMNAVVHSAEVVEADEKEADIPSETEELVEAPVPSSLTSATKPELERAVTAAKTDLEQLASKAQNGDEEQQAEDAEKAKILVAKLAALGAKIEQKDKADVAAVESQADETAAVESDASADAEVGLENAQDALEVAQASGNAGEIKAAEQQVEAAEKRVAQTAAAAGKPAANATSHANSASGGNATISGCANECSGHGSCVDGACACDEGFHGTDCSATACSADCQHGTCKAGVCECDTDASTGWPLFFGDACDLRECPMAKINGSLASCSGHGACISTGDKPNDATCDCDDGYTGRACGTKSADVAAKITTCNGECMETCRASSQGDADLYLSCYNSCSRKCSGVDALVKKEEPKKSATPAEITSPEPEQATEEPTKTPPSPVQQVHAAVDEAEREVLGDVPPTSNSRNSFSSLRNAVGAHFDAQNAASAEMLSPSEKCTACTEEFSAALLEHSDDKASWVQQDCRSKGVGASACQQLASHQIHANGGEFVRQYCTLLKRC